MLKRHNSFFFYFSPLVALALIFLKSQISIMTGLGESSIVVLSIAFLMVTWWASETAPISIVAFFPLVLFPLLGIIPIKEVASLYAHPVIFLFMGGFMIALALEKTGVSERIALAILSVTGSSAKGVILGFITATALLSMWISNTATTVMMIPIAESVIKFIQQHSQAEERDFDSFSLSLMLCIAYSANIGGIMTPIGTPPNVVLKGFAEGYGITIEFAPWMMMSMPIAIVLLAAMYLLIVKFLYPFEIELQKDLKGYIKTKFQELGKINRPQKLTLIIFSLTCLGWIFKSPLNKFFGRALLDDTLTAMLGGVAVFICPVNLNQKKFILPKNAIKDLPWDIIILFGGGMALAHTMGKVGLVDLVAQAMNSFGNIHPFIATLILSTLVITLTEMMSNVALCNIALPMILAYAHTSGMNPMTLAIPATLAASFAFSMPISTPPNAIVFATGRVKIAQMLRAGAVMNLIAITIIMTVGWFALKLW